MVVELRSKDGSFRRAASSFQVRYFFGRVAWLQSERWMGYSRVLFGC